MKPYNWEEIKGFLTQELKKTKHILTFGTVGSCNVEHDVDIIITKKASSPSADFYKEVHKIFDDLDNYLKDRYNAKVIRFSTMLEESLISNITTYKENDLLLHTMVYFSHSQMNKDWAWASFGDEDIDEKFGKIYNCILGNPDDLLGKKFQRNNYYDNIFNYMYLSDKSNSHYPEKLLISTMNFYFDFLYRKMLKLKSPTVKNSKDVRRYLYELCEILDKLNKNWK